MRSSIIALVVQRLNAATKTWEYFTEDGAWSLDILMAKTWPKSHARYADKISVRFLGAIVTPYEVG